MLLNSGVLTHDTFTPVLNCKNRLSRQFLCVVLTYMRQFAATTKAICWRDPHKFQFLYAIPLNVSFCSPDVVCAI